MTVKVPEVHLLLFVEFLSRVTNESCQYECMHGRERASAGTHTDVQTGCKIANGQMMLPWLPELPETFEAFAPCPQLAGRHIPP